MIEGFARRQLPPGKTALLFAALLLFISTASAQQPPGYTMEMNKDFVSWTWLASIKTTIATGSESSLEFSNRFTSNLYEPASQTERWKDDNKLSAGWRKPLADRLDARTFVNSHVFSDDNTSIEFSKHLAAQQITWNIHPNLRLSPSLGWTVERAFNRQDQGWYSDARLNVFKYDMGGYVNNTELNHTIRGFPDRNNSEFTLFTSWNKSFSTSGSDSLRLGYQFTENRHYVDPDRFAGFENPQERVVINARFLYNQLNYRVSPRSQFALITTVRDRRIEQSNPLLFNFRDELALENQVQYITLPGRWLLRSAVMFSQRNDQTPQERTDINALQATLTQSAEYRAANGHRLWGNLNYTKYEYNTPRGNIPEAERQLLDDRDELRFIFSSGYQHRFSDHFLWTLRGNLSLYHQIYLRSGRSANNNWNRIFQLATGGDHAISGSVRHQNEIKILANYTVFDFDEILPRIRSFVFRKLVYSDSITVQLTRRLSLQNIYQLEVEDNGTFFKEDFSQQVTKELTAHFIQVGIQHGDVLGMQLSAGVSYLFRDEWTFPVSNVTLERERTKSREYRAVTPRLTLIYPARDRLTLYMTYAPTRTINRTFPLTLASEPGNTVSETVQNFTSGKITLQILM